MDLSSALTMGSALLVNLLTSYLREAKWFTFIDKFDRAKVLALALGLSTIFSLIVSALTGTLTEDGLNSGLMLVAQQIIAMFTGSVGIYQVSKALEDPNKTVAEVKADEAAKQQ